MWKIIGGRCIYQTPNGAQVHQNLLYRWLTLGSDALQTVINRRAPEKPSLGYINPLIFAVREQPADCCLLGLGGAAVAHALSPYLANSTLLAIENNTDVIHIASNYFMTSQLKNLSIIKQDAVDFVHECAVNYQHIMVDLYEANTFPEHCNSHNFFVQCKNLLFREGVLALNLTNSEEQWPIFKKVRDVFYQRTVSFQVEKTANLVVLACNSPSIAPLLDLLTKSQRLKELKWDARWGCIARIR